jgi:hypothetical protein
MRKQPTNDYDYLSYSHDVDNDEDDGKIEAKKFF